MEISEIKQSLTIANVLHYYGLKTDKQSRLHCPFHEDKTPSFQVYYKTQTAYCFSSNCKTHGKSLDVIDFILHKENCTKAEAINKAKEILNYQEPNKNERYQPNLSRENFLGNMYQYFKNAVHNSKPAKDYLESRSLDNKKIEVGYNGGQFHHGARKDEELIKNCLAYGLLIDKGQIAKTGDKAYSVFGKWCICFALKNKENQIVSLYFRSTLSPSSNAENKLPAVANRHFYLKNRQGIYPNYPNVNTKKLILTESIIDAASLELVIRNEKLASENYSILACFGTNGLNEEILNAIKDWAVPSPLGRVREGLEIIFAFDNDEAGRTATANYAKMLKTELQNIKITTLELPNKDVNETLQLHTNEIFIKLLDERKAVSFSCYSQDFIFSNGVRESVKPISAEETSEEKMIEKTSEESKNTSITLGKISKLIGKSGIIGEENSSKLLFLIAISYKNKNPLHGIVQGSSGSGKTHLISKIIAMMPQEDVLRFTRITESSLYNYGEYDLCEKIILIEDLDGLKEDALYALRELISNQSLSSLTSVKDKKGNNNSKVKSVKGQFSSLSATTKGELYEDNMNRSFVLAVDESEFQTEKIIHYQNQKIGGLIDEKEEEKAIEELQKIVRNLRCYEVNNPYATHIQLPSNVKNKRRLNEMFQSIVKQITIVNQNQRRISADNKLFTEIEDIKAAVEILFESIILKIDELDGSLRQFLEKIKKSFKDQDFNRFEAMEVTGFKKSQLQVYLNELVRYGYLKQTGHPNKGFKYKLSYNDDIQKVRDDLKVHFTEQIRRIKLETNGSQTETKPTENE
jgi:DNA primase